MANGNQQGSILAYWPIVITLGTLLTAGSVGLSKIDALADTQKEHAEKLAEVDDAAIERERLKGDVNHLKEDVSEMKDDVKENSEKLDEILDELRRGQ